MKDWDDPSLREKPSRKRPPRKPELETMDKPPMLCDNCGKPFLILLQDHCECPIWTVGLKRVQP